MVDTIVIGAGQTGLAMGYYMKQHTGNFLILDKGTEAGASWANRYDSLQLFTPRRYSSLPGLQLPGEPEGFPSKNEIASYLKAYEREFDLPVQYDTEVTRLTKNSNGFSVATNKGSFQAAQVVVATGPFQTPYTPSVSSALDPRVFQCHSADYRNPDQLLEGNVLIVGGGNSGAQIAVELAGFKETFLAVSHPLRFFPLSLAGKSSFWWFDKMGILSASAGSVLGRTLQKKSDPIFGSELKQAIRDGRIQLRGRVRDGKGSTIRFADTSTLAVDNIIWATGFKTDYSWIRIEGGLTGNAPQHERGVSPISGLYFLGMPWQHRRGSGLLQGVGDDAAYVLDQLLATSTRRSV